MFKKFVFWCLKRLFMAECYKHSPCSECPYGTAEERCVLLDAMERLDK